MKNKLSLSCSERQDLEMARIGWHTQVVSTISIGEGPLLLFAIIPQLTPCSCHRVYDGTASIGDHVNVRSIKPLTTRTVSHEEKLFCRHPRPQRPIQALWVHARDWNRRGGKRWGCVCPSC